MNEGHHKQTGNRFSATMILWMTGLKISPGTCIKIHMRRNVIPNCPHHLPNFLSGHTQCKPYLGQNVKQFWWRIIIYYNHNENWILFIAFSAKASTDFLFAKELSLFSITKLRCNQTNICQDSHQIVCFFKTDKIFHALKTSVSQKLSNVNIFLILLTS